MKIISVIVPVYNTSDYLEECVESVLSQSFKDFELILINDGSQDESGKICDLYADRYPDTVMVIHQQNSGVSVARNAGMKAARGEYFFFLDSDDWIKPDTLQILYDICRRENADISVGSMIIGKSKGGYLHRSLAMTVEQNSELMFMNPGVCGKLFRASLFTSPEIQFPGIAIGEDLQVLLQLIVKDARIATIDDGLYFYRQHDQSATHSKDINKNRDVMHAIDGLMSQYKALGIYDKYKQEIEFLAIKNVILSTSVRVIFLNSRSILLREINCWFRSNFHNSEKNKYLYMLDAKEKIIYMLILHRCFGFVKLLYTLSNALKRYSD